MNFRLSILESGLWTAKCRICPTMTTSKKPWRGQFPRPHDESDLFWRGIVVGLDGSLLFDGLNAYVLARHGMRAEDGHGPIQRIDYFHALIHGIPMAQMYTNKEDVHATEMISTYGGFTVQRVINFQRRWRVHRPQISGFALVDSRFRSVEKELGWKSFGLGEKANDCVKKSAKD